MVVVGARDEAFLASSAYLAAKIEGAVIVTIEGAGHTPQLSHAAAFLAAVVPFIAARSVG